MKKKNSKFFISIILAVLSICIIFNLILCNADNYRRPGYNVILISLDTLRSDHLGIYGYPKNTSPHIDQLARKSVLFKNSFSNASWTLPSHMSLMTSLYPSIHGVSDPSKKLSNSTRTLAEVLNGNGYLTAAFTAGYYVSKVYGFDQGFDLYKENYNYPIETPGQGWRLKEIAKNLSFWLNKNAKKKFFLFIHSFDTHEPFLEHSYLKEFESNYDGHLNFLNSHSTFIKSQEYKENKARIQQVFTINLFYSRVINEKRIELSDNDKKHLIALYDNEIRFVDHYIGKLLTQLENLDLMDKTIIILWSDHGEELLERGNIQHGGMLYEELIRVPLIVYLPGFRGPRVNSNLAQSIDIAPTILDILGIGSEKNFMGIPLFSKKNHFIVGQHSQQNIIRTKKYKLMSGEKEETSLLFNLRKNPDETVNVFNNKPDLATKLKKEMLRALSQRPGEKTLDLKQTKEDIEKLRALGYIK